MSGLAAVQIGVKTVDAEALKEALFALLAEKGAKLMGVGDLRGIVDGGLTTGVSVAVPVPRHIVRDLQTAPTREYYDAYHALNAQLDEIVECGAAFLEKNGFQAYANTTKVVKKDDNWCTPLPHKTVATRAGLGWIGKSCLLVTPQYGGAVRISSLLTDAPLPADRPVNASRCGGCSVCVDNCPGEALTGTLWTVGTQRADILRKEVCKKTQIARMKRATGIEVDLCGLCFAVCPYTQRYLREG